MEIKLTLNDDQAVKLVNLIAYWADVAQDIEVAEEYPSSQLCDYITAQLSCQVPMPLPDPEIVDDCCCGDCCGKVEKECDCSDGRQCGCGGV